jgi:hypothetical protein
LKACETFGAHYRTRKSRIFSLLSLSALQIPAERKIIATGVMDAMGLGYEELKKLKTFCFRIR